MIQIGSYVTYKKGLYADEDGAIYKVLEVNGDRALLEYVSTTLAIPPQSVGLLDELKQVPRPSTKNENL